MISWYYVEGSERIGPVSEEALKELVFSKQIEGDTFVWKKGFSNWEHLKNVEELNSLLNQHTPIKINEIDWNKINEKGDHFFIRSGSDRSEIVNQVYGPYNLEELTFAKEFKRINEKTEVFLTGMKTWQSLNSLMYFREKLKLPLVNARSENHGPYYLLFNNSEKIVTCLINRIKMQEINGLAAGDFSNHEELIADIYFENKLMTSGLKLKIKNYDNFKQELNLSVLEGDIQAIVNEFKI